MRLMYSPIRPSIIRISPPITRIKAIMIHQPSSVANPGILRTITNTEKMQSLAGKEHARSGVKFKRFDRNRNESVEPQFE